MSTVNYRAARLFRRDWGNRRAQLFEFEGDKDELIAARLVPDHFFDLPARKDGVRYALDENDCSCELRQLRTGKWRLVRHHRLFGRDGHTNRKGERWSIWDIDISDVWQSLGVSADTLSRGG